MADVLLALLQMSDSAFPIGAASHSSGLEGLVNAGQVTDVKSFVAFSKAYLAYNLSMLDLPACLLAHRYALAGFHDMLEAERQTITNDLLILDARVRALKISKEGREASRALGRRLLHNISGETENELLSFYTTALANGRAYGHHSLAYGLAAASFGAGAQETGYAFSYSSMSNMVAAAQRLLPIGQTAAQQLLWSLHPLIRERVEKAILIATPAELGGFMPGLDIATLRHPWQTTRLFIS